MGQVRQRDKISKINTFEVELIELTSGLKCGDEGGWGPITQVTEQMKLTFTEMAVFLMCQQKCVSYF